MAIYYPFLVSRAVIGSSLVRKLAKEMSCICSTIALLHWVGRYTPLPYLNISILIPRVVHFVIVLLHMFEFWVFSRSAISLHGLSALVRYECSAVRDHIILFLVVKLFSSEGILIRISNACCAHSGKQLRLDVIEQMWVNSNILLALVSCIIKCCYASYLYRHLLSTDRVADWTIHVSISVQHFPAAIRSSMGHLSSTYLGWILQISV